MHKNTGNQFWKQRSSHGRNPIFKTPDDLWSAACEYFQWVEDNPLMASELVKFQGKSTLAKVPKMRAMTLTGLYLFLDISELTFSNYGKKSDFIGVVDKIRAIIYNQKFEGAAADLLNSNIISRELGLSEKTENKTDLNVDIPSFVLVPHDESTAGSFEDDESYISG